MRALTSLSLAAACVLTTGCGSFHLHNENAAATSKAAADDFAASKFGERLKGQRAILLELEERDVEAFRKLTLVERDQTLLKLGASTELIPVPEAPTQNKPTTKDGFAYRMLVELNGRLKDLDGDPAMRAETQKASKKDQADLSKARQAQAKARQYLAIRDPGFSSIPPCNADVAALASGPTADKLGVLVSKDFEKSALSMWSDVEQSATMLGTQCSIELNLVSKIEGAKHQPNGLLANALAAYKAQKDASDRTAIKAQQAKVLLNGAAKELANTTKDLKSAQAMHNFTCPLADGAEPAASATPTAPTAPTAAPSVPAEPAASESKLCQALANLEQLGSVGQKIVAEEKIEKIGRVLQALSGIQQTAAAGEEVDTSLALIAATTRLDHALRLYRQADRWPSLEPLIIEKQLAEAELISATAQLALDKQRLAYHLEIVEAIRLEIDILGEARTNLFGSGFGREDVIAKDAPCTKNNAKLCSSYEALLRDATFVNGVPAERSAYRAMARLSESFSTARDRQMTAHVRLELSGYQRSLILSEQALASWKAVIETPIDLLRQYHAGGIKPSDIAPVLQAIGIFTVAGRVE
jgi:hypothetical protein